MVLLSILRKVFSPDRNGRCASSRKDKRFPARISRQGSREAEKRPVVPATVDNGTEACWIVSIKRSVDHPGCRHLRARSARHVFGAMSDR